MQSNIRKQSDPFLPLLGTVLALTAIIWLTGGSLQARFDVVNEKYYTFFYPWQTRNPTTMAWVGGSLLSAVAYGIGEEAGWRGFALPRLQQGRSALWATFILSVLWAIWHVPMFFYRFEFGIGQAIGFFIGLFAGAIWLTFLYNSTGGSTLMVALWHTAWNVVNIFGLVVSVEVVSMMSAMVMVAAVIIVIAGKPARLSLPGRHTIQPGT